MDGLAECARSVYLKLNKVHEGVSPILTPEERRRMGLEKEYGGTTGTIKAASFVSVVRAMHALEAFTPSSVFLDVGCGTGRASLTVASALEIRASLGFDVDKLQVFNACTGYQAFGGTRLRSPALFFHQDAFELQSLSPATHVYTFMGYPAIAHFVARLAAASETTKVLAVVYLRESDVVECGLALREDKDVVRLSGLKMAGRQYCGVVVPMTEERRVRVLRLGGLALPWVSPDLEFHTRAATESSSSRAQEMMRVATDEMAGRKVKRTRRV